MTESKLSGRLYPRVGGIKTGTDRIFSGVLSRYEHAFVAFRWAMKSDGRSSLRGESADEQGSRRYKFPANEYVSICIYAGNAFDQRLMNTEPASRSRTKDKPTDGLTFAYDEPARALTARGRGTSYKSPGTSN